MVSFLFAFFLSTTPAPPVVTPLVDAEDTPGLRAVFEVDAPADVVLDLLWDVDRFKEIFPDIHELVVEGRPDAHTVDVRFLVDAVVAKPSYTLRRRLDPQQRTIRWVSIAGDLKRIVGGWSVEPTGDGGARVVYESFVDVGVPGVSGMYRGIVIGKVEQMAARVRRAAALAASSGRRSGMGRAAP